METEKLLEMVDSLDIKFCFINKNTHGTFNRQTNKIKLNLETMVVEVFLHEVMHSIHPLLDREEDEEIIDELTFRVWKRLTTQQIRAVAKKLLERRLK